MGVIRKVDPEKKMEIAQKVSIKRRNIEYLLEYSNATPFLWFKGRMRCFFCFEPVKDSDTLREHTTAAHEHANLELTIYDRFNSTRNKDQAVKLDVKGLTCKLCTTPIESFDKFISHIVADHDADYDMKVTNCVLPFVLDKENMICALCDLKFPFFEYLLRHANKFHLCHNFVCDICGSSFQGEANLKMHNRYYHREGGYPCGYCDHSCKTLSELQLHHKNIHLLNLYTCPNCPETFKSPYFRRVHLANVHGKEELKFPCPHCPKVYPQESIMSRHMRRVHLKEKNVECKVCGDKFFGAYDLKLHMIKHNGEKRFVCSDCGKKFAKQSNLTTHSLTHTADIAGFVCEICQDGFNTQGKLKEHIQNKHPEYELIEPEPVVTQCLQDKYLIEYLPISDITQEYVIQSALE